MGLAIVKHICALYGGRVDIQSAEGRGTTVTAVLRRER
ncbi:ATP-binding protein [Bittarella massiliensis]|uniref:ATP-binding protein n=1 Tax=Bittarella massiliensis (ex Durand et al. 2017) TaxID=1720313 RepID=A0AAW5KIX1_9FIRM|nr:ATP-binding protein [Bittarella massiliensis (ex Durand et al. 2017)]MCQ4950649.1 ATP-binding protein [Bittarella massiliensis (ex Durand et al. 2017)]